MSRASDGPPERLWYVQSQGRVWGPYPEGRIAAFVAEGRVAPATLLSEAPNIAFRPAIELASFHPLFVETEALADHDHDHGAESEPQPDLDPQDASGAGPQNEPVGEETAGAPRPLLVFAALFTVEKAAFTAALAMHGPYERIGQGLWLVRARMGPAALRNALSRRLRGEDTLLVVEASLEHAAWFNLDQAEERKLRALWAG